MTDYDDLALFLDVAKERSLRAASRRLRIPISTVSRRLAALEQSLGTQLLVRTNRVFTLTDDGRDLVARCVRPFEDVAHAVERIQGRQERLTGELRITAPVQALRDTIGSWLIDFAEMHPDLSLRITPTDNWVDLIAEGYDLAFRVGPLQDSADISRKLWDIPFDLVASKNFLDQHQDAKVLNAPDQVLALPTLVADPVKRWRFVRDDGTETAVSPNPRFRISDIFLCMKAANIGMGIAYAPAQMIPQFPNLVPLQINGWRTLPREMYAIIPYGRHRSAKIRAVTDYVRDRQNAQMTNNDKAGIN